MRLIFFGPPGSGKGTYATGISKNLGIPHISTGDIFRAEIAKGSKLGKEVEDYIKKGELVPDETVIKVIKERLKEPDCKKGFILDGFPRTIEQMNQLEKITKIDLVINLNLSEKIIIEKTAGHFDGIEELPAVLGEVLEIIG